MISLTTTGSPQETLMASALLAIISDPAAAKKRLDELMAEKQLSLDAMENARKATLESETNKTKAAADLKQSQKMIDEFNASYATRSAQMTDRDAALATRQTNIEAAEALLLKHTTELETNMKFREASVNDREAFVTAREEAATKLSQETAALKADYETKIAALHSAMAAVPAKSELKAEAG